MAYLGDSYCSGLGYHIALRVEDTLGAGADLVS